MSSILISWKEFMNCEEKLALKSLILFAHDLNLIIIMQLLALESDSDPPFVPRPYSSSYYYLMTQIHTSLLHGCAAIQCIIPALCKK